MSESCLIAKLDHYVDLTVSDKDLLGKLEDEEWHVDRKHQLRDGGDEVDSLYVVKTGWLFSYTILPDGRRQVLQLHYPGDIVGIPDLAFEHATTAIETLTGGCLCPFPKKALDEIFEQSPRVTALLFSIGMVDHVVLLDRIRAISRMSAMERLAHFLLEIQSRLRITDKDIGAEFELPLSQDVIGDAIGLTNVYVSKSFARMEERGDIRRDGRKIEICREDELRELCDFHDRYMRIDTSWFPEDA